MRESAKNVKDETDSYSDRSRCCPHIFTSLHNTTDASGTFLAKAPFCRRQELLVIMILFFPWQQLRFLM
jgi:hypothetical protein